MRIRTHPTKTPMRPADTITCVGNPSGKLVPDEPAEIIALASASAETLTAFMESAAHTCNSPGLPSAGIITKPFADGPLSVWALVRRAARKAGGSLPDIECISAHVTRTLGTGTRRPHR